jgi:hypothetical protein
MRSDTQGCRRDYVRGQPSERPDRIQRAADSRYRTKEEFLASSPPKIERFQGDLPHELAAGLGLAVQPPGEPRASSSVSVPAIT